MILHICLLLLYSLPVIVTTTINEIRKSESDENSYKYIELENGLGALLISDPKIDKAAASLDINVGYFSDPEDVPGLAHFLEHMLFMGTKKYPGVSAYSDFISQHGGRSNAFTDKENTNYHFEVSHQYLKQALDIFVQFFISPLFDQSCIDKEVNAVNSEHGKNLNSDQWKVKQAWKQVFDKQHPLSKFGTGNFDTLNKPRIRERMMEFYDNHYSSDNMKLVVIGRESLNELEYIVREIFLEIPRKSILSTYVPPYPFPSNYTAQQITVQVLDNEESVSLHFLLPDLIEHYQTIPNLLLEYVLEYEGPGSLHAHLKNLGFVKSTNADIFSSNYAFNIFSLYFKLTEQGAVNVDHVLEAAFSYIHLLQNQGIPYWIVEDLKSVKNISFAFAQKAKPLNYVVNLAQKLQIYSKTEDILTCNRLMDRYDGVFMNSLISILNFENLLILRCSPKVPRNFEVEKYYGTKYCIEKLSDDMIDRYSNRQTLSSFHLPNPNRFLSKNFTIIGKKLEEPLKPQKYSIEKGLSLWHKLDDTFLLPQTTVNINIYTLNKSFEFRLKILMFLKSFSSHINEDYYDIQFAGLRFDFQVANGVISLKFSGYSQRIPELLDFTCKNLAAFRAEKVIFEREKAARLENILSLQNQSQSYLHSLWLSSSFLWDDQDNDHGTELATLRKMEVSNINEAWGSLGESPMEIEALIYGNIMLADSVELLSKFTKDIFPNRKIPTTPLSFPVSSIRLREGKLNVAVKGDKVDSDSYSIEYYLQFGPFEDIHLTAMNLLFLQIFQNEIFTELRTNQQLGYVVALINRTRWFSIGASVLVQSTSHNPIDLERRICLTLNSFLQKAKEMKEFGKTISILRDQLLEPPISMEEESSLYWAGINSRTPNFHRPKAISEYLQITSQTDFVSFIKDFVMEDGKKRRAFTFHIWPKKSSVDIHSVYGPQVWWSPSAFRQEHDSYPGPKT